MQKEAISRTLQNWAQMLNLKINFFRTELLKLEHSKFENLLRKKLGNFEFKHLNIQIEIKWSKKSNETIKFWTFHQI